MPPKSTIAADFNQKGAEFLKVELETGLTFAQIALSEKPGTEQRIKNRGNALKAYQTVLRLRDRLQLPAETAARDIQNALERLKTALEKLGEKLS